MPHLIPLSRLISLQDADSQIIALKHDMAAQTKTLENAIRKQADDFQVRAAGKEQGASRGRG